MLEQLIRDINAGAIACQTRGPLGFRVGELIDDGMLRDALEAMKADLKAMGVTITMYTSVSLLGGTRGPEERYLIVAPA